MTLDLESELAKFRALNEKHSFCWLNQNEILIRYYQLFAAFEQAMSERAELMRVDEEKVERVEVAIAEAYMLIPKNSPWEEIAEKLAKAAIAAMLGKETV